MMIGQEQLMMMRFARRNGRNGFRDCRARPKRGLDWRVLEFAFNLWQAAVIILCLLIVICG